MRTIIGFDIEEKRKIFRKSRKFGRETKLKEKQIKKIW
jgi:hypothetical protein